MSSMNGPKDWQPGPIPITDGRVAALLKRIKKAAEKADLAFWAEIAKGFPEVKSGDFPPDASMQWTSATENAVLTWLEYNYPNDFLLHPILEKHQEDRHL